MKRIITIMVLGLMVASAAMADGPKYKFASVPSGSFSARQNVSVGVNPGNSLRGYKPGTTATGRSFAPSATPGNVSSGASVRTSRTIISHRKSEKRSSFAASSDYSRNPSASIVTSSTSHSASSGSYGGRSTALGLSSAASTNSGSYSGGSYSGGSYSGGSGSTVVYGRTSQSTSYATSAVSSSSSSSGPQSMPGVIAGGGNGEETDGAITMANALSSVSTPGSSVTNNQVDGPLGDAILPLLLLMSLVAIYKWRFKR